MRDALVAFAGYVLLAASTIHFTTDGRTHATVWPADALILALLLNAPRGRWSAILLAGWLGNLLANALTRDWTVGLVLYGAINMGQALFAAVLLQRSRKLGSLLPDSAAAVRFLLVTGIVAPAVGAITGTLVSVLNYGSPFWSSFVRWYASNALGFLVFTPFLKAVFDGSYMRCFRDRSTGFRIEAITLLCSHAALCAFVFTHGKVPLLFLPLSSLLLLTFRMGQLGTKAGVMIIALSGAMAAMAGMRIIGAGQPSALAAILFQGYLAVTLCTALPVAAAISSRTQALQKLAERDQALRQIMSHSPDTILGVDISGRCCWADGNVWAHLGVRSEDLLDKPLSFLASIASPDLAALLAGGTAKEEDMRTCEFTPTLRPEITLEASLGILTRDEKQFGAVITLRDVSARKSREDDMTRMVETDDLTGILNRKGFRERIAAALADGRDSPRTLALIDLDHFKNINDNFGHSVGDRVLQHLARHLSLATRNGDVVGRLGGDEFAILFRCDLATAKAACERIAQSLHLRPIVEQDNVNVTVSISCGIAQHRHGMSRSQLFDAADTALYDVKHKGRNGVSIAEWTITA